MNQRISGSLASRVRFAGLRPPLTPGNQPSPPLALLPTQISKEAAFYAKKGEMNIKGERSPPAKAVPIGK
jgi:hypothetical protein